MLPGFEKCVVGMRVGDKQSFKVPQAFGPRRQELVVYADKNDFPENREPAIGKEFSSTMAPETLLTQSSKTLKEIP